MVGSYRFDRATLFCFGVLQVFVGHFLLPSSRLFATNTEHAVSILLPTVLFFICGLLCIVSSTSFRLAGIFRFSILGLLIAEGISFGPELAFGFLLAGGMAGDSGSVSVSADVFIIGFPLAVLAAIILGARATYRLGKVTNTSFGYGLVVAVIVGLVAGGAYLGAQKLMSVRTHLATSIDPASLDTHERIPTLTGTITGDVDICVLILKPDLEVGPKLLIFGGNPDLIKGTCTTSGDVTVSNGHWSSTIKGYDGNAVLNTGTYQVVVTNWATDDVVAKDTLVIH